MRFDEASGLWVHDPGNYMKITAIWAVLSVDAHGNEGICGYPMGPLGVQPMVTGSLKVLEVYKTIIPKLKAVNTGKDIRIVKYEATSVEHF